MSLINEALKKAQHLRTGDPAGVMPPMPGGGGRVTKHGQPRSTQQLVVLAAGGIVLVVLSVVATVWLLNRKPEPSHIAPTLALKPPAEKRTASPVIVPPLVTPPATPSASATSGPAAPAPGSSPNASTPAPAAAAAAPAPVPAPQPALPAASAVAASGTGPVAPPAALAVPAPVAAEPPAPVAKPDERVHAFIDAIRVTGIRSSGGDSRVLMNDRVYRVNDIVDRTLGLRLTKVEHDNLTFTDANGVNYVKYF